MGVVNAELLARNVARVTDLAEVFSSETIASAMRDKTGDATITESDVDGLLKLGNLGLKKMLISAEQEKILKAFAEDAKETANEVVARSAKQKEETSEGEHM